MLRGLLYQLGIDADSLHVGTLKMKMGIEAIYRNTRKNLRNSFTTGLKYQARSQ
jgi:hypothetical protein